ncbi:MAG: tRNA (adenosine(37)-N6)-threonylcarbamoyltransferase complex transferase subunit TsaD [Deltaproteobacteria bacterium]|nr:tRNA (adenosine(37)-N6)-threonylcarbamoyltransferase complex transferase subunit TsaD [Deltaproteobacteria bacterium]
MLTLGIETSCDDTAAAVLRDSDTLLSSVLSSQDQIHTRFGGVVPELASRTHLESIVPIVHEALDLAGVTLKDIDLIAVTQGPGLIGSLLVGFCYAKALSYVTRIPFVGVDHMAGHLLAVFLEDDKPEFPYIALIVSGGTSSIYLAQSHTSFSLLGRTRDDAAGEAFDKVAKLLGLSYPGGPRVSAEARAGNSSAIKFPRAWLTEESLDFSFSGLKTAVLNHCNQSRQMDIPLPLADICASFQEAIVDVLVEKTMLAARRHTIQTVVLGGGVSANPRLRESMFSRCQQEGKTLFVPRPSFCTDNGAMIAMAGFYYSRESAPGSYDQDVYSRSQL